MGEKTKHRQPYDQTTSSTSKQTIHNYSSCFEMIKSWTLWLRVHESRCFPCFAIDFGFAGAQIIAIELDTVNAAIARVLLAFAGGIMVGLLRTLLRDHGGLHKPFKGRGIGFFFAPLSFGFDGNRGCWWNEVMGVEIRDDVWIIDVMIMYQQYDLCLYYNIDLF